MKSCIIFDTAIMYILTNVILSGSARHRYSCQIAGRKFIPFLEKLNLLKKNTVGDKNACMEMSLQSDVTHNKNVMSRQMYA